MLDFIMLPVVMAIVTLGIYKLFELFVCKRERIMLIEKMNEQSVLPKTSIPLFRESGFSFSALKIGSLLMGMGFGLLIGYFICYTTVPDYWAKENLRSDNVSLIYAACVLGFGGLGLIIAFVLELKLSKRETL